MTNELIYYRMRHAEDLNPLGQIGEQPEAVPGAETKPADSTPESLGTQWFVEESATAADGVGGEEWLTTMAAYVMEMPRTMAGAAESSKAGARATDIMLEFRVQRPAALEEQVACPEAS